MYVDFLPTEFQECARPVGFTDGPESSNWHARIAQRTFSRRNYTLSKGELNNERSSDAQAIKLGPECLAPPA